MTAEAGWYQDGNTPGIERWWDGSAWTSETRPIAAGVSERAADACEAAIPSEDSANGETPPGWYPDPEIGFRWRFWTGSSWTSAIMVAKKRGQLGGKLSAIMIVACILSVPGSLFALYGALPTCEGGRALWEGECRPLNDITRSPGIDPVFHPWFLVGGLVALTCAFAAIIIVHKAGFPKDPIRPIIQPRNALAIHGLTPPTPFEPSEFQPYAFASSRSRQVLGGCAAALLLVGWIGIAGAIASASAPTCAEGGKCAVGDRGPAGGIVFYDAGSQQSWGRYLEVSPRVYVGPSDKAFCLKRQDIETGSVIGTGKINTQRLVELCGESSAAGVAASFRGGGYADWYLPAKEELQALLDEESTIYAITGADNPGHWAWTSTQFSAEEAWASDVLDKMIILPKSGVDLRVVAIRAF